MSKETSLLWEYFHDFSVASDGNTLSLMAARRRTPFTVLVRQMYYFTGAAPFFGTRGRRRQKTQSDCWRKMNEGPFSAFGLSTQYPYLPTWVHFPWPQKGTSFGYRQIMCLLIWYELRFCKSMLCTLVPFYVFFFSSKSLILETFPYFVLWGKVLGSKKWRGGGHF